MLVQPEQSEGEKTLVEETKTVLTHLKINVESLNHTLSKH